MRVAVLVRVDGALQAGDQLVGARVDGPASAGVLLPARDADRQHRRARRHTGQPLRPAGAHQQARHLGAVPLEPGRIVGLGRRKGAEVAVAEDVDPVLNPPAQERLRAVDARVEQRDRDPAAVEPRQHDLGIVGGAARKLVLRE